MKPTIKHLTTDEGEHLLSHYRITKNKYGQDIAVPVIDVRDGWTYRAMVYQMEKASNRSKYINYTEYHRSHKTPKQHI
jgi:hypothetical protein